MPPLSPDSFAHDSQSFRQGIAALSSQDRSDIASLPPGALAFVLAKLLSDNHSTLLVVVPDSEAAERLHADVAFFLNDASIVAHLPTADLSPYVDVLQDREQQMVRLAILSELAEGLHRGMIVPATGLIRKIPPRATLLENIQHVRAGEDLDRQSLIDRLISTGYTRAPLAEDPGTFSARGALIDVYTASLTGAVRIEFDDDTVSSIKTYDPETQKAALDLEHASIPQARDIPLDPISIEQAKKGIRAACDDVNLPTSKTLQLIDGLERGAGFVGMHGFMPAFYETLESVIDHVGQQSHVVIDDPLKCVQALRFDLSKAEKDFFDRQERGEPAIDVNSHYVSEETLSASFASMKIALNHGLVVQGDTESTKKLDGLLSLPPARGEQLLNFDVRNHDGLKPTPGLGLKNITDQCQEWIDQGMHVLVTTRTHTQLDRVRGIFSDYGVNLAKRPQTTSALKFEGAPAAHIAIGSIVDGFTWPTLGCVVLTEEEIFGRRTHKRKKKRNEKTKSKRFAEDLRRLKVGDFIVHADHGVARYHGIERKEIAQSAYEKLQGIQRRGVEAMVLEYAGGDKLFVPVTRLGLVRKFSGKEGATPRLDKLGGSTFASKKSRVRRAVQQMAEELLKLYAERAAARRPSLRPPDRDYAEFEAMFPFEETRDQANAIEDVLSDLEREIPMDRLVCGDVGFGKTEIAMRAAHRVAMNGKQVAILCPTTVLAQQHFRSFQKRFEGTPVEIRVLSRFVTKENQTKTLTGIKEGVVDIAIGTHRLLSTDVHFANLGLLVVDEEQRFGVTHKERIKKLKSNLDVLTLSATPIPRTLQLAVGGIRDLSLIKTPPSDRRAVRTFLCRWDAQLIKDAIERELSRGGQIFYVYNRIEGLYERAHRLQQLMPTLRIAVAHGQMKEAALERAMTDFVEGKYDVLCSTAIIESGLDIPRANTVLIDRAELFGLSQLYQLRGRVGRSSQRAYCYLITPPPSKLTDEARMRLQALERFAELGSGFSVATLDMEIRGTGDLLGADQSGSASLVGFDLFVQMLSEAVAELQGQTPVMDIDPELTFDIEHYLPDDYIEDVGLRLSFYRRFATATEETQVETIATELEDRFGKPPDQARQFVRIMSLQPRLRAYRIVGCEAKSTRITLHLREDTPLDPAKVMNLVAKKSSPWSLSPDMKLSYALDDGRVDGEGDIVDKTRSVLQQLSSCIRSDASTH